MMTNSFAAIFFRSYSCYRVALCFRVACTSDSTNLRQSGCLLSARLYLKYFFEIHTSLRLSSVFPLVWHKKAWHMWHAVTSLPSSCGQKSRSLS